MLERILKCFHLKKTLPLAHAELILLCPWCGRSKLKLKTKICLNHVTRAIIIWISIRVDIARPCFSITDFNPGESNPLDCDLYRRMPTNEMLCALCTWLNINFAVNWCYVGQSVGMCEYAYQKRINFLFVFCLCRCSNAFILLSFVRKKQMLWVKTIISIFNL